MSEAAQKKLSFTESPRLGGLAMEAAIALLRHARRIAAALKHRRELARLACLDDRMLADIAVLRSDLDTALRAPLWQDPSSILAERVRFRRAPREGPVRNTK